ncbi:putative PB1 domain-containing protein [Helianthus annuus]|nr:putative PB1 domain-containing protein [Helianthus annuus]KAJ0504014.1 putative PB1 domain-containing protein [Helianthus annuus]
MGDDDTNRWPKIIPERIVSWSPGRGREISDVVDKKILHAFKGVKSFPLKRIIIQFWRPETIGGKRLLACYGCPYALSLANHRLWKYRSRCIKYYYSIDDLGVPDDPMTISGAPPATAFLNHFPEVVLDLRIHRGTPLVDLALECELTCFMMIPVFSETGCVGIVEVSMRIPADLLVIFNDIKRELKRAGLSITPPRASWQPHKSVGITRGGFTLAKSEIAEALQVAVQSHAIPLGQVWMAYENLYDRTSRMLLGKLNHFCVNLPGDPLSSVEFFYRDLVLLSMKKMITVEGLIGRTLATRQPHLCKNIHKLRDNRGVLAVLSANVKCASFVICLRSSHTGEVNYLFEFFWPQTLDHLALMEALLLTLREHLPSFKYAFGARLGDEVLVVDVENSSSGSASTPLKIFPRNKSSAAGRKRTRASVGMETRSIEGQSELTNINDPEGDDDLIIVAVYKIDYRLFYLPSSPTYKVFLEKVYQEFDLNPAGTYKIEYQVLPGDWYSLTNGTCLKSCVSSYRTSKNIDYIKLHVRAVEK